MARGKSPAGTSPRGDAGKALGLGRDIPRRDFLQGALVGTAGLLTPGWLTGAWAGEAAGAAQDAPGYYPPRLTGLRGSHPGSFEAGHALRDGAPLPAAAGETEDYDLVIVGAGISGLAAAHFYQARGGHGQRILLLENHDDFGGHAKRNEFELGGRIQLLNGGTLEVDSPHPYSATADGLLRELGVDVRALIARKAEDRGFYQGLGLKTGAFFDAETFGADHLVVGMDDVPMRKLLRDAPLAARTRADIARVEEGRADFLPGLSAGEKKDRLSRMSYRDFLRELVKVDEPTVAFYQASTHGEFAVGIDAVSALDGWAWGLPGFDGMKLPKGVIARMGTTPSGYLQYGGSPKFHFPDGNATFARLLVRRLIPAAIPGHSAEDIVTAPADYSRLDRPDQPVRIRLNSTVVNVRNQGGAARPTGVEVTYVRGGAAAKVRARHCVLASWNMMIPYLCPELPEAQKAALHLLVKAPLVYTSVALRNWQPFVKLGVYTVYAPGSYYPNMWLNQKVDLGDYHTARTPDQPTLLHMLRTPCRPGLPEHEQNKAGRAELLGTSFEAFERQTRGELQRIFGPGGFDAARDIEALTVNRWPHGYTPEFNPLFEPLVPEAQRPHVIGRARFGNIAIANADSGAYGYTDGAIDQAARAVGELLSG
ncbi:MAG: NAD(P)-binding protein [Proteobacteria bacterium]|nr:NAD(P)-binding protein [Pseudomonadota bacterium]